MADLEDGRGKNGPAGVNSHQQLDVFGVTMLEEFFANHFGDAYNINTEIIGLTDDDETPLLYAKNRETEDLVLSALAFHADTATGGSGAGYLRIYDGPTGGTIISDASPAPVKANRRFGDSGELDKVDAYLGSSARTFIGGTKAFLFGHGTGRMFAAINIVLPRGASALVTWEPPTGTTAQNVYAALIPYLREEGALPSK